MKHDQKEKQVSKTALKHEEHLDIMTPERFVSELDHRLRGGMNHLDSIMDICEKFKVEVESVPKLLNGKLRKAIKSEATELNMLKIKREKIGRLPV